MTTTDVDRLVSDAKAMRDKVALEAFSSGSDVTRLRFEELKAAVAEERLSAEDLETGIERLLDTYRGRKSLHGKLDPNSQGWVLVLERAFPAAAARANASPTRHVWIGNVKLDVLLSEIGEKNTFRRAYNGSAATAGVGADEEEVDTTFRDLQSAVLDLLEGKSPITEDAVSEAIGVFLDGRLWHDPGTRPAHVKKIIHELKKELDDALPDRTWSFGE
jgi:hypothetical protein